MAARNQPPRLQLSRNAAGDETPSSPSSEYVNPFADPEGLSSSGASSIRSGQVTPPAQAHLRERGVDDIVSITEGEKSKQSFLTLHRLPLQLLHNHRRSSMKRSSTLNLHQACLLERTQKNKEKHLRRRQGKRRTSLHGNGRSSERHMLLWKMLLLFSHPAPQTKRNTRT